MWDVKSLISPNSFKTSLSFISTMWDVKFADEATKAMFLASFISTMWDVKKRKMMTQCK